MQRPLMILSITLIVASMALSGCAKMVSPYPTEPRCRADVEGNCLDAHNAWELSRERSRTR